MDLEEIKSLIDILTGTDIVEINVENDNDKIMIKRGCEKVTSQKEEKVNKKISDEEIKSEQDSIEEIVAPMVGTFYRAPAPDADPFIEVGDIIESGDTLCIIEAMKLMNEIEAETKGKIVEILIEDAEPVEYGQPLFRIELL